MDSPLDGFASLGEAGPGDISFYGDARYRKQFLDTAAGVTLVPRGHEFSETELEADHPVSQSVLVGVDDPSASFTKLIAEHGPKRQPAFVSANHSSVYVDPTAVVGEGTELGAGVVIGPHAVIGGDCKIHPNVVIMDYTIIGDRVVIHPGAAIGSDGFGFEAGSQSGEGHSKIEQVGIVQIGNDVEIGANTTIDRARFGKTVIGNGCKIDNLVQIAHNCVLGENCIVVSQTGIAGSSLIGDNVILAAQSGVAGHVKIASGTVIAARGGVTKDITEPGMYMGFPAETAGKEKRRQVAQRRIADIIQRVKEIEKKLA